MSDPAAADASYCADMVRNSDYDRYATTLFAPPDYRETFLALYAFNAEVAGVRSHITQPLAGEVRLQWWTDVLSGKSAADAAGHPVASRLLGAMSHYRVSPAILSDLVAAHRFDLYDEPMLTRSEMEGYLDQTAGNLFLFGARLLGERSSLLDALIHHAALAYGLLSLIEAVPRHSQRRQLYLPTEMLDRFNVKREALFAGQPPPELAALVHTLADVAEGEFNEARALLPEINGDARSNFLLLALIPLRLKRLAKCGYDPFRLKPAARFHRLWTLWAASRKFRKL